MTTPIPEVPPRPQTPENGPLRATNGSPREALDGPLGAISGQDALRKGPIGPILPSPGHQVSEVAPGWQPPPRGAARGPLGRASPGDRADAAIGGIDGRGPCDSTRVRATSGTIPPRAPPGTVTTHWTDGLEPGQVRKEAALRVPNGVFGTRGRPRGSAGRAPTGDAQAQRGCRGPACQAGGPAHASRSSSSPSGGPMLTSTAPSSITTPGPGLKSREPSRPMTATSMTP